MNTKAKITKLFLSKILTEEINDFIKENKPKEIKESKGFNGFKETKESKRFNGFKEIKESKGFNGFNEIEEPKEFKMDYSDLIRGAKNITSSFLLSTVKSLNKKFPRYLRDSSNGNDVGEARFYMCTDYLQAIVEKLGYEGVQYEWRNINQNTAEKPLNYFMINYWIQKGDKDVILDADIHVNDSNFIEPYLSTVAVYDNEYDKIIDITKSDYDVHFAKKEELSKRKYAKYSEKPPMFWWSFVDNFNKGINVLLKKYDNVLTDEESINKLIASSFLLQVCKLLKIFPIPRLSDIKSKHSYWSYYEAEVDLSDNIILAANLYIVNFNNEYQVLRNESYVKILDNGWNFIMPENKNS